VAVGLPVLSVLAVLVGEGDDMKKRLVCLISASINLFLLTGHCLAVEPQESIGEYMGTTDDGSALYLRKIYPDKRSHSGFYGFRYYVVKDGQIRMNIGTTRYCYDLKPVWTVVKDEGNVVVKATSLASVNMLKNICGFKTDS
jgi:hypothetical protein